jgi:hypothetical protein
LLPFSAVASIAAYSAPGAQVYFPGFAASHSLGEAFDATRRWTGEKRQPSLPQAFFGALAEEKLTELMRSA